MQDRPQARTEGLITELVGRDLVVYDTTSHTAHSLPAVAASVWELCDGEHSSERIAHELRIERATVARAIAELAECGLLEDHALTLAPTGISRREAAKRLAKVGGAAIVAPLIYSVAVSTPAAMASGCALGVGGTVNNGHCTAAAGGFGTSSPKSGMDTVCCASGACYQTVSTKMYYCVAAGDSCVTGGTGSSNVCLSDSDCCAGDCDGMGTKHCSQ